MINRSDRLEGYWAKVSGVMLSASQRACVIWYKLESSNKQQVLIYHRLVDHY